MLSDNTLREYIEDETIEISNYEQINEQLTSSGFTFRLGPSYKSLRTGEVYDIEYTRNNQIILEPNEFYLMHTVESIRLPDNIIGMTNELMSRALSGVRVATGKIDPNFSDKLVLGVENRSGYTKELKPNTRIIEATFYELDSTPENTYDESESKSFIEQLKK